MLSMVIEDRAVVADALEEKVWISNIAKLITCHEIKQKLSNHVYRIVEPYFEGEMKGIQ